MRWREKASLTIAASRCETCRAAGVLRRHLAARVRTNDTEICAAMAMCGFLKRRGCGSAGG